MWSSFKKAIKIFKNYENFLQYFHIGKLKKSYSFVLLDIFTSSIKFLDRYLHGCMATKQTTMKKVILKIIMILFKNYS